MSSKNSIVTENHFRYPEFVNADPEDYEFRDFDGKIVRKDRWKKGLSEISEIIGCSIAENDIEDVVREFQKIGIGAINILHESPNCDFTSEELRSGPVTQQDFRMPEFKNANLDDYEIRSGDKKVVRKDRWITGFKQIAKIAGFEDERFEIEDVIEKVMLMTPKNKM